MSWIRERIPGLCDVCGLRWLHSELREYHVLGVPTGKMVCPDCDESTHPQYYTMRAQTSDAESVPNSRPDNGEGRELTGDYLDMVDEVFPPTPPYVPPDPPDPEPEIPVVEIESIIQSGTSSGVDPFTFSAMPVDCIAGDLIVIGCVSQRSAAGDRVLTGLTIDGNAATIIGQIGSTAGGNGFNVALTAWVATGTLATADIIPNWSGVDSGKDIMGLRVRGLVSTVANDSGTNANAAGAASVTLDVPYGGIVIGMATTNGGVEDAIVWTGVDSDPGFNISGGSALVCRVSMAHDEGLDVDPAYVVTADSSSTVNLLVAASWA